MDWIQLKDKQLYNNVKKSKKSGGCYIEVKSKLKLCVRIKFVTFMRSWPSLLPADAFTSRQNLKHFNFSFCSIKGTIFVARCITISFGNLGNCRATLNDHFILRKAYRSRFGVMSS